MRIHSPAIALAACVAINSAAFGQDVAAGEKVFLKCKVCHQVGEAAKNGVGPGYNYTPVNKNSGLTWDEATLKEYLKNPRAKIPGTKMVFPGLPNEADVDNLIAYLKQFGPDGKKS